ncbi:MAG: tyrosine-type recombinase/integrase [Alphaproteobacteria bacterium]
MPTVKFAAKTAQSIKPPQTGRVEWWDSDTPGLLLRVASTGKKTWTVWYRQNGRPRRLTLGAFPQMPLTDARQRARETMREVALGKDPAGEKQEHRKAETFRELGEEYIEKHAKPKKRSWKNDDRALRRDLYPEFGNRKAREIKRREVIRLLENIVARGAPILANRTLEIARRIFNFGIEREILEVNPCTRIKPPSDEHTRERVLSDDELKAVWESINVQPARTAAFGKLLVLTAQRKGEVSRIRRPDLDLAGGWWTIPKEFSKNKYAHRVPLCPLAVEIIKGALKAVGESDWVFCGPRADAPVTRWEKPTNKIRKASGVDFTLHDIRRTVATKMTGDLGIDRATVGKVLNHVQHVRGDITAKHYDLHSYDAEKRAALEAWAQRLEEIVSGKKSNGATVHALRRA